MRLTTCITTRNDPERLDTCLRAIWNSKVKPYSAIVSDDSPDLEIQQKNSQIVEKYPGTTYILGPQRGVNANRNCAVNFVTDTDLIAFVDDDVHLDPDFIENALKRYEQMSPEERKRTFITGNSRDGKGYKSRPTKLSFRGYYTAISKNETPECVHIHAAVFPRSFFNEEQWEEDIFFGQGDAILCLRALKRGYRITHCPELKVCDTGSVNSTNGRNLRAKSIGLLTDYDLHQEAARLYIGIKRYKEIFPNPFKLATFLLVYFAHITIYLLRNNAVKAWPLIIQRSHFLKLL
ncbi:MAG: glycosyltransferase [Cyanobacteria bacterium]|jgi:glycosyltransferase involved in cell wall biosynthesis|nr:glycosyltransferase [Cyanobacteria bacterium GSL.Bin1]